MCESRKYKVTWTDQAGKAGELSLGYERDARELFGILARSGSRGDIADALFINPDGHVIDSWGT